uniref:Palmitoyltransferase n=1 Tax=Macrostomum lignano TaxID=282301 RepID=A0A1I8FL12_9PLAT
AHSSFLQSLPWLESGVDGNDEDNNRGLGQQQTHLCCLRCGRCGCYLREKFRMNLYQSVLLTVLVLAITHIALGSLSIVLGTISTIEAVVWMAHRVSPSGLADLSCASRPFPWVSLLTAVISIQLLRLGLVNHTTDGHTYQKENLDVLLLCALGPPAPSLPAGQAGQSGDEATSGRPCSTSRSTARKMSSVVSKSAVDGKSADCTCHV